MRVVDVAVVGATVGGVSGVPFAVRRESRSGVSGRIVGSGARRWWFGPGVALAGVVALIYLNQVLVGVYVLRVHGGDPSFVARYLPEGWFAMAQGGVVGWVAGWFPAPGVLAPSVLRVQAFLELPFVLLAYATVLRGLDRGLYRRVMGSPLVWGAAAAYTLMFALIEWDLRTPYTEEDIAIRAIAAVVTPPLIIRQARAERGEGRANSAAELVAFAVFVWALGHLVLVVYDSALLYNLGRFDERLGGAAIALVVLGVAGGVGRRAGRDEEAGWLVAIVGAGLRWGLVYFFVPALAVRYGVNFGTPVVAALAGLAVAVVAGIVALREVVALRKVKALREVGAGVAWRWGMGLGVAAVAGAGVGYAAVRWIHDSFYEAGLLRGACAFLVVAVVVCAGADRIAGGETIGHLEREGGAAR